MLKNIQIMLCGFLITGSFSFCNSKPKEESNKENRKELIQEILNEIEEPKEFLEADNKEVIEETPIENKKKPILSELYTESEIEFAVKKSLISKVQEIDHMLKNYNHIKKENLSSMQMFTTTVFSIDRNMKTYKGKMTTSVIDSHGELYAFSTVMK